VAREDRHNGAIPGERGCIRVHDLLVAGTCVTANRRVTIGSELPAVAQVRTAARPPPSGAPGSSRRGGFGEPTRRHRRPGEDAFLGNRRSDPRYRRIVLLQECFGALARSLTEVLHHHGAPLGDLSVLDRLNAMDRERREHPQNHCVLAIRCRIRDYCGAGLTLRLVVASTAS
jgi:hypothetical protein